jgi:TatD DNase family protein
MSAAAAQLAVAQGRDRQLRLQARPAFSAASEALPGCCEYVHWETQPQPGVDLRALSQKPSAPTTSGQTSGQALTGPVAAATAITATTAAADNEELRTLDTECDALEERLRRLEARAAAATAAQLVSSKSPSDPMANLVDFDANITHDDLRPAMGRHVTTALCAGLRYLVVPSVALTGPRGAVATLEMSRCYASSGCVVPLAGVHPFWAGARVGGRARAHGCDCTAAALAALECTALEKEVRAIGECGLDFSKPATEVDGYPAPEEQLPWFEGQVALAVKLRKPLFLHVRDAHRQFLEVLERAGASLPPCVVHAFTGTESELVEYRGLLDCYIGVTGFILRKNNPLGEWLPKHVPLSRLLVETDSPYMGFRGCRKSEGTDIKATYPNVPASLSAVVAAVAACYATTPEIVAKTTTKNALRLLSIGQKPESTKRVGLDLPQHIPSGVTDELKEYFDETPE